MLDYDLYGFLSDVTELARRLGNILGLAFVPHYSWYRSGDYYRHGSRKGEQFTLQRNRELDDGPAEPDFQECPILLYVERTARSATVGEMIAAEMEGEALLLRHESF